MIRKILFGLVGAYVLFLGGMYWMMTRPPMEFAAVMAKLPPQAMMAFPFEPMWTRARAGSLAVGAFAPDFELPAIDKKSTVRLSSFRGVRPVVLVFGSYT